MDFSVLSWCNSCSLVMFAHIHWPTRGWYKTGPFSSRTATIISRQDWFNHTTSGASISLQVALNFTKDDRSTYGRISQVHCVRVVCTYTAIRILVHVVSSDHLTNHLPLSMVAGQQEAVQATLCRQTQEQRRKEADSNTRT